MAAPSKRQMLMSPLWLQATVLLFVVGFSVLFYLAARTYQDQPPIPERVVNEAGETLFTRDDITAGQHVFQKYGLMEFGTLFGHGAYLGPDFTADYLHRQAELMVTSYARLPGSDDISALTRMRQELKSNHYDPATDTLVWEYLDLGRLWQALLTVGLLLWAFIIYRGLRGRLAGEHVGNMPYLFFYASLSIPVFYAVGMVSTPQTEFTATDFWRFWVVHLWVEDFLELFTTATVAYAFVLLGIVSASTGTRVIYLSAILYSVGGVIGTMHHLYFSGEPAITLSLGAFFSAMEVIPLLLLTFEAWSFLRAGGLVGQSAKSFPHWWAVWFLVAVGFWNFLGAGVYGFLINLPIVSYYEIGTNLTANHAHTAMFGVYGMLAVALMLFGLRYLIPPDRWSDRAAAISFWSLNVGLVWMSFVSMLPVGFIQIADSFQNGYYHARELSFVLSPLVNALEWARLPGDLLFILGGVLPLLYLAVQAAVHRPSGRTIPEEQEIADHTLFTEIGE